MNKLTFRIDVDYPYNSRIKSFLSVGIKRQFGNGYLDNAKTIARMLNLTKKDFVAYWFFTPATIPDSELLELLQPESKHHVELHVASDPAIELKQLARKTGRNITYYTIHGTDRLLARILWGRSLFQAVVDVPKDFGAISFHQFPVVSLDWLCYRFSFKDTMKAVWIMVNEGRVIHFHPEWLHSRGLFNHRGAYCAALAEILYSESSGETKTVEGKQ